MRLLLLRLEGPLQSWGDHSKWDDRDTGTTPTKSGVIGLIACCMGIPRGDRRLETLHAALSVSVRVDRPGKMGVDFQTIQSKRLMTADGKYRAADKGTIISRRQYLQDAAFLAVVASPDEDLLDAIADALRHPHWTPFLGRKSCVPTTPILAADSRAYCDAAEALRQYPLLCRADRTQKALWVEVEDPKGEYARNDQMRDAVERRFTPRSIRCFTIPKEEWNDVPFTTDP